MSDQLAARVENLELAVESLLVQARNQPSYDRVLATEALNAFRGVLADLRREEARP